MYYIYMYILCYYIIVYFIILYCIILYYTILCYIIFCHIILCYVYIIYNIYIYTYILCIIHLHGLQIYRFHVFVQWVFGNFGTPKSSNGEIIWVNMDMLLFFIWKRHDDEILGKKQTNILSVCFRTYFRHFHKKIRKLQLLSSSGPHQQTFYLPFGILSDIFPDIYSDTLSDILSNILFCILCGILFYNMLHVFWYFI